MTNERDDTLEQPDGRSREVDNDLDSLLPVPGEPTESAPEHDQVDGPVDEVLPIPGEPDSTPDDASTREEMEVDTTADGVDDFIPLHDANGTTAAAPSGAESSSLPDQQTSGTCLVCGHEIGDARFCPDCGTEQVPASRLMAKLAPLFMWSRPLAIRVAFSVAALLTLVALLADSGATALIISASTLAIVILIRLADQLEMKGRNFWIQVSMMALVGTAVGLPIAWLATRIARRSWFEGGVFNFSATNFGGVAVETVGSAPFLVWLTNGILLPLVVILAIGAAPSALRMALAMPPRETSGMMLSAAVGAGYIIGSGMVFYWGFYSSLAPIMTTSEWTLTILGVAVIRPLVWVYASAMLGAVVWRYQRNASLPGIAVPAGVALALPLFYNLASLALAPVGLWASTLAGIAFAAAAVYLHTRFLQTAIENDESIEDEAAYHPV